jgi:BirA family biotin operon repressor/biotin-[acetyl-CoA-carboxylase] ligase
MEPIEVLPGQTFDAALQHPGAGGVGGGSFVLLERVASTMDAARELATQGGRFDGLVVLADLQERGRGRLSRSWLSPPGTGLTFSVVLRPRAEESRRLWAMAGVGVAAGLRRLGVAAGLKWPNDVVVAGRKVCGLLVEASWSGNEPQYAVIGVGCNVKLDVAQVPAIAATATSLGRELGHPLSRMTVLKALLQGLDEARLVLRNDPAKLLRRYRDLCVLMGRRIVASGGGPTIEGVALDIDEESRLVIRDDVGAIHRLTVGEVSLAVPPG